MCDVVSGDEAVAASEPVIMELAMEPELVAIPPPAPPLEPELELLVGEGAAEPQRSRMTCGTLSRAES